MLALVLTLLAQTVSSQQPLPRTVETRVADSEQLDAFSRVRVSEPVTVFDAGFQYDLQPFVFEVSTSLGASVTHTAAYSAAAISTAAQVGSTAIIQTKQYHRYIPGKSHLVLLAGVVGSAVANVVKRLGYFDENDGLYLEQNGTTDVAVVRRTSTSGSVVNNRVVQADWNMDRLDGSRGSGNPSWITLDLSKAQIIVIDLQWLGEGRVRMGFDIDGRIIYVHEFLNANSLSAPFIRTANLPVRWEASGNGVATMYAVCTSVQSEAGVERLSYAMAYQRAVITAGNGSATYAFSIRPAAMFNSITNRMLLSIQGFDLTNTGAVPVKVEVYYGTTVGGTPSWSTVNTASGMQVDTAGTPSGGTLVQSFIGSGTKDSGISHERSWSARYPLTLDIAGTGYNIITVYVTGLGATATCYPGVRWEEVR